MAALYARNWLHRNRNALHRSNERNSTMRSLTSRRVLTLAAAGACLAGALVSPAVASAAEPTAQLSSAPLGFSVDNVAWGQDWRGRDDWHHPEWGAGWNDGRPAPGWIPPAGWYPPADWTPPVGWFPPAGLRAAAKLGRPLRRTTFRPVPSTPLQLGSGGQATPRSTRANTADRGVVYRARIIRARLPVRRRSA